MRCHLRWRRSRARARLPRSEVWTGAHVAAASSEARRYASTLWQCGAEEPLLAEVTQVVCTQSCRCQGVPLVRMILPLCLRAPVKVWEVNPKRGCLPSGSGRALQTRTTFPPGPRSRFLDACALHLGEPFSLLGCALMHVAPSQPVLARTWRSSAIPSKHAKQMILDPLLPKEVEVLAAPEPATGLTTAEPVQEHVGPATGS